MKIDFLPTMAGPEGRFRFRINGLPRGTCAPAPVCKKDDQIAELRAEDKGVCVLMCVCICVLGVELEIR